MQQRREVRVGPYIIGDGHPTVFVAELGINHLGSLQVAKDMVKGAHEAGAHLLKLQTYIAEKRYEKSNPRYEEFTSNLTKWQLPQREERELWEYAASLGAILFTSIFDEDSIDFADSLGSAAYKLAAFEITNKRLVRKIAEKGKPVVFSRGMATHEEVDETVRILEDHHCPVIILHTISSYPLQKKDSHLRMIHTLRDRYLWPIGHSDHTPGAIIPPLAAAAGANMIEKHFSITPKRRESDNFFSVTPEEVEEIVFRLCQIDSYMGRGDIVRTSTEEYMWDFRRYTK
jgi:sialic acid synthase SpsE